MHLYNIHRGCSLSSLNDEWEHQSMAVNYAKGYGIYKLGAYAPIEEYYIDTYDATLPFLRKLFIEYPTEYYHRAIGFSVIVGTLYKYTSTDPFNLRVFNFVLLFISWLLICKTASGNKKFYYCLLYATPIYLIINFDYINTIGDETLLIFSVSALFFVLYKWIAKMKWINSIYFFLVLAFSIFIKTTLLVIPVFLFLFFLLLKRWQPAIIMAIGYILFIIVLQFFSYKINERHKAYQYVEQEAFHKDMLSSNWSKDDTAFIKKSQLKFRNDIHFSFDIYKSLATYLFERQFYTKKDFFLSGQSLFLLIDGNNETCIRTPEEHIGSWSSAWKIDSTSFYYNYKENESPYIQVIRFYLHKIYLLPILLYIKLEAGYAWNYIFIIFSAIQAIYYYLYYMKVGRRKTNKDVIIVCAIPIISILFSNIYMTPFIIVSALLISALILYKQKINKCKLPMAVYLAYFIIYYFMFLTLVLFGLNRYTCIANGMTLFISIYYIQDVYKQLNHATNNNEQ